MKLVIRFQLELLLFLLFVAIFDASQGQVIVPSAPTAGTPTAASPTVNAPITTPTSSSFNEKLVISGIFDWTPVINQYDVVELTACTNITDFSSYSFQLYRPGDGILITEYKGNNFTNIPAGTRIYIASSGVTVGTLSQILGNRRGSLTSFLLTTSPKLTNFGAYAEFHLVLSNRDGQQRVVVDVYGDTLAATTSPANFSTFRIFNGWAVRKSGVAASDRFRIDDWTFRFNVFNASESWIVPPSDPYTCTTLPPSVTPAPTTPRPTRAPTKAPTKAPTLRPTMQPTAAPSKPCFSEANTVEVQGKGIVAMKELQIGDKVKDANGKMVHVYSFGHYQPNATTEYLQLYISGRNNKRPLEVSRNHLLFVNGVAVPASTILVGDVVQLEAPTAPAEATLPTTTKTCNSHHHHHHHVMTRAYADYNCASVEKIQVVVRKGVYAPFTTSGTIVVSGVAASSYVTLQDDSAVLVLFGRYRTFLSMHWLSHMVQTPHRLVCSAALLGAHGCRKLETYNDDGISVWAAGPYYVARVLLLNQQQQQHHAMALLLFLPVMLVLLVLYLLEVCWLYVMLAYLGARVFYYYNIMTFVKKGTRKVGTD